MTVDELVAKLQEYPGYWPVKLRVTAYELDELTGEEVDRVTQAEVLTVDAVQDSWTANGIDVVLS